MPRLRPKTQSLKTPDVTCACSHRNSSHEILEEGYGECLFCDCRAFQPRDRGVPDRHTPGDWIPQASYLRGRSFRTEEH